MATDSQAEIAASVAALQDLGPGYDQALAEGLVERIGALLVALVLAAAAGGAAAVRLLRRRRYHRRYGPVPAPRRPRDDQPTGQSSRIQEMNGPRHR